MESEMRQDHVRPNGRAEVSAALKVAALALLAERGTSFSIREVAKRADVNHGLVHRHFGSKQELITAALADRTSELQEQLNNETSPVDLSNAVGPETATLLARLILDDATSLIPNHGATTAVVRRATRHVGPTDPLSARHRAALANAMVLGWNVFGPYLLRAAEAPPTSELTATLRTIVDQLVGGEQFHFAGEAQ